MNAARAIARYLADQGVTDAFGIPGGVVIELLYALEDQEGIVPHLSYHEQAAGFAACGYAQVSGRLGIAYATKGPGFTNLMTAIADAYYDSVPVLFLTAHSCALLPSQARVLEDQEMDSCAMVRKITKYSRRVDELEELLTALQEACSIAQSGRKGPVFLDIRAGLFKQEIQGFSGKNKEHADYPVSGIAQNITAALQSAKRPLILVGDGINQAEVQKDFNLWLNKVGVPVVSSRYSHNVVSNHSLYFGYVGSHGIRYANYVLSKADCIVALGNRLAFPEQSASYAPIVQRAKILRCEVDESELERHKGIQDTFLVNLEDLMPTLAQAEMDVENHNAWLQVCHALKRELKDCDCSDAVAAIDKILSRIPTDATIVCDVGNNEFWVSRACVHSEITNRTLYSKSFGALGSALGKSIGVYYATQRPVVAFIGDQGLQLNIQELQYIAQHQLPITIVLLNNAASGMILDRERTMGHERPLHTTAESGYRNPDFAALVSAYGIRHDAAANAGERQNWRQGPHVIELKLSTQTSLTPSLPKGAPLQRMLPEIDHEIYCRLDSI